MSTITASQITQIKNYINQILPAAGMAGDIADKVRRYTVLHAGISDLEEITEEQTADMLDFFTAQEPKQLVEYIETSIAPKASGDALDVVPSAERTEQREANKPDFRAIAERSFTRGEKRILPTIVGVKKPRIEWKDSPLDLLPTAEWDKVALDWLNDLAAQFPHLNACVVAKPEERLFIDHDTMKEFCAGYEAYSGEKYPITFTTSARENRCQEHWLQTDATRELGNIKQFAVDGIDLSVRQRNEYVLAEGSLHPDGSIYKTVVDAPAVPMPDKMVAFIRHLKMRAGEIAKANGNDGDIIRNERGLVPHTQIHHFMLSAAGELRNLGYGQEIIEIALLDAVHKNCEPPIDDSLVKKMAESICTFPSGFAGQALVLNMKPDAQPVIPLASAEITSELLHKEFPAYDGKTPPKLPMLVEDCLPEGVTFFGSLPGTGKTWMGLSVAKALTTGMPLWGVFNVPQKVAVLYLIPEASDFSFKNRLKKMGITQDKDLFRFRTISQGVTKPLQDALVIAMVKELAAKHKVLLIVDTAVRFLQADDENSSMDNSLVKDSENLRANGANVLFMHHSPKASKDAAELTLENVLRGTGDFGAMADAVYGFRRDEAVYSYGEGAEEMDVVCVKARDMERPPLPFRIALSRKPKEHEGERTVSIIDETGDLGYIGNHSLKGANGLKLVALLKTNPSISLNELYKELKMRKEAIKDLAAKMGWRLKKTPVWDSKGEHAVTQRGVQKFQWTWTCGLEMSSKPDVPTGEPTGVAGA